MPPRLLARDLAQRPAWAAVQRGSRGVWLRQGVEHLAEMFIDAQMTLAIT
jgi:hypothetical protein